MKIPKVFLLIESSRGFGRDLLTGIANYARIHGPWSFYHYPPFFRSEKTRKTILMRMKKEDIDGIIARDMTELEEIKKRGIPAVIASTIKEKSTPMHLIYPIVTTDNESISKMAADHLRGCGFKNFAFCGYNEIEWSRKREEAFVKEISHVGYKTEVYQQPKSKHKRLWENEQQILAEWLKLLPKPIGLMACSDDRAQNVVEAAKISEIRIPEEIAVIGVDDDKLVCNLSSPPLSSIALNTISAGYDAADLLDRLMNGEPMAQQKILIKPTHVAVRLSTSTLPIEDPDVVKAIRFIREHAKENIGVNDVVEATMLSRRVLETRFRSILHRSILKEIRRLRVEQIAQMLVETNLPIKEIAQKLGYTGTDHISRYFRKEAGISLLAYRHKYGQK